MNQPTVGVVILNWNRLDLTKKCLAELGRQTYKNVLPIVIDNGSTDGSIDWLNNQPLELVKNRKNLGYARAVNQGVNLALDKNCDYIVTLNNDTEPTKDWVEKLVEFLEEHPEVELAQGATMQTGSKKRFDSTGIYLEEGFIPRQRALGLDQPQLEMQAIGPNAAGAIYRADLFDKLKISRRQYFDNRFFAYVEDVDFDLRAYCRGHHFALVPAAKLYHHGSLTGNKVARRKMFWGARNQIWLVYKNAPWPVIRTKLSVIVKSHLANLQYLRREQRPNFWPYLAGLIVGLISLPLFWRQRWVNLRLTTISQEQFLQILVPANPPLSNPLRKLANLLK